MGEKKNINEKMLHNNKDNKNLYHKIYKEINNKGSKYMLNVDDLILKQDNLSSFKVNNIHSHSPSVQKLKRNAKNSAKSGIQNFISEDKKIFGKVNGKSISKDSLSLKM